MPPTTDPQPATTNIKNSPHTHNNNQTNPKPQPKQKTKPKTQPPEKLLCTETAYNNNQKENSFSNHQNSLKRNLQTPQTPKQPKQPQQTCAHKNNQRQEKKKTPTIGFFCPPLTVGGTLERLKLKNFYSDTNQLAS